MSKKKIDKTVALPENKPFISNQTTMFETNLEWLTDNFHNIKKKTQTISNEI